MTSREDIQKTLIDCMYLTTIHDEVGELIDLCVDQSGKNGFERAHTWKSEIARK